MKMIFAQWAIPFCLVLTLLLGACGEKKEETGDSGEANNGGSGSDNSTLDTTAPTSLSISINAGAANSTSDNVTLTLSANDTVGVTGYYASETNTTPESSASGWKNVTSATAYTDNVSFILSSGYASKTVYVWFKDAARNVSDVASDSITTTAPVSVVISNSATVSGTTYTSSNLEWQIATASETDGLSSGLTWTSDQVRLNWADGVSYCTNLNLNSQTDWRFPTKEEIASLIDTSVSSPKIVSVLVATTQLTYWTSTPNPSYSTKNVWYVHFSHGTLSKANKTDDKHRVRCVRGG